MKAELFEDSILKRCLQSQATKPTSYKSRCKITKRRRREVYERDGHCCLKCGSYDNLTIDHIVPVTKGGLKRKFNLQTLCAKCNNEKGESIICYRKI